MNKLSAIDGETLLDMDLNAPRFCVQYFLPQGLSILGGAPKMGKSWLVMDLCVRIAKGEAKKFYDTVARQRAQIQSRIKDLDNIIRCLYEDRVSGRITLERYDTMASGYEQEQAELKQELESITARICEMDLREQYVKEFMENARVYIEMPKLTPELLRVFIRCIEVYEKEEKYSRTCGNTIVIHYTFQMPKQKTVAATMAATTMTADGKAA